MKNKLLYWVLLGLFLGMFVAGIYRALAVDAPKKIPDLSEFTVPEGCPIPEIQGNEKVPADFLAELYKGCAQRYQDAPCLKWLGAVPTPEGTWRLQVLCGPKLKAKDLVEGEDK